MTEPTPQPADQTDPEGGGNYRLDIVTEATPDKLLGRPRYFDADDRDDATTKAVAMLQEHDGPADRYGRLYHDSGLNRGEYVCDVSLPDAPTAAIARDLGNLLAGLGARARARRDAAGEPNPDETPEQHRARVEADQYERFLAIARGAAGASLGEIHQRYEAEHGTVDVRQITAWTDRAVAAGHLNVIATADPAQHCTAGDGCPVHPGVHQVHAPDIAGPARSRTVRVMLALDIADRDGQAVFTGPDGEIGSCPRAEFLDAVAAEFGVDIVPRADLPAGTVQETDTEFVRVVDGTTFRLDKQSGLISIDHPAVAAAGENLRRAAEPVYDRTDPVQVMAARRFAAERAGI